MNKKSFKPSKQYQQCLYDIYIHTFTIILLIISAFFLNKAIPPDPPTSESYRALFIFPHLLQPETKERTIFIILVALVLPLNFVAIKSTFLALKSKISYKAIKDNILHRLVIIALAIFFTASIFSNETLYLIAGDFLTYRVTAFLVIVLTVSGMAFQIIGPSRYKIKKPFIACLKLILVFLILISVLSFRLQPISLVNEELKWTTSFEAILYTVSQVNSGRTLLADLPAQYGMYAEILNPVFSLIGLSVLSFTAVMSLLQILGVLALLNVCLKLIGNHICKIYCIFSIFLLTGGTWIPRRALSGLPSYITDEVYQYWPLRFFFPAASIYTFYILYKKNQSYEAVSIMAFLSGLAITWNLESGIAVTGAYISFLLLQTIFPVNNDRWATLKKLLLSIGIIILWLISFWGYLSIKSGKVVDLNEWLKFQRIFYYYGFGMLPMPITKIHLWMAIIGVYIFTITGAMTRRIQKKHSFSWDILFFLSILGLGIFPYYQGRSHIINLITISWPAIIIAFILTDRTVRAIKAGILPLISIGPAISSIVTGIIFTSVYIDALPALISLMRNNYYIISHKAKTPLMENIAFIRQHTSDSNKAVIISKHQAVYFTEAKLMSAIKGPGIGETILSSDLELIFSTLKNTPIKHLFVDKDEFHQLYEKTKGNYSIKDASNYGLIYLTSNQSTHNQY